jgi:hypothetical protein
MKTIPVAARIPIALNKRLDRATEGTNGPYSPSKSQIITRGIELALTELDAKKARK